MFIIINIFKNIFKNNFIGLIKYINGNFSYISIQHGCFIGQKIKSNLYYFNKYNFIPGNFILLKFLESNMIFSNILFNSNFKIKFCKSAGTFCKIISFLFFLNFIKIRLPTGKKKIISGNNFVLLGRNSNINYFFQFYSSFKNRKKFKNKSIVRGVAMNPIDHPHGGRTKTNKPEVSPWGWITKKNH